MIDVTRIEKSFSGTIQQLINLADELRAARVLTENSTDRCDVKEILTECLHKLQRAQKQPVRERRRYPCPIDKTTCVQHGYVHGYEAEELRTGIEELVEAYRDEEAVSELVIDLDELLKTIDARDSAAFCEAKEPVNKHIRKTAKKTKK